MINLRFPTKQNTAIFLVVQMRSPQPPVRTNVFNLRRRAAPDRSFLRSPKEDVRYKALPLPHKTLKYLSLSLSLSLSLFSLLCSFPMTAVVNILDRKQSQGKRTSLCEVDPFANVKVGLPFDVKHLVHVDFNSATGFTVRPMFHCWNH